MKVRYASPLVFLAGLAVWEFYCRAFDVPALIVPAPSAIAATLWSEIASGRILPHLAVTTGEMLAGLALGCAFGFTAGLVLGESAYLRRLFHPYVIASQVIPKLALGPLFIIWFGFGMAPTVVVTALICFFPVFENTMTALSNIDADRRELFRMLRATRWQTLWRLKIPSGLPTIMAGVRVSAVLSLVGAVVGEFIGGREGLGASVIAAQGMMDSTLMFALFVVITLLGMATYQAVAWIEALLLRRYSGV
jgi:NitT/TauT family transport system permease protein